MEEEKNEEEGMNYNLLEEKWIPVLWKDGKSNSVSIIEALKEAGECRCITLASPLDLFAVHRFMLTLLYWKSDLAGGVEKVRESLLKKNRIPNKVLDGIKQDSHYFDLFDKKAPFMQDPTLVDEAKKESDKKSIGSLFAELASGTNIAHFNHGDDENMRLCLPCATLGMLRVIPWSQAGGQGKSPSVHNAPPIMAIASGDNLAITLGLNLVPLDVNAGEAKWSGHFKPTAPTKPIPYLEALSWNPRRICLPSPQKGEGVCWYCGQGGVPTVGKIVYMKNENTKLRKKGNDSIPFEWNDPSAFYPVNEYRTIRSYSEVRALDNKDLTSLLEKNTGNKKQERPKSLVIEKNMAHEGWHLIVPCTNPANNKTFDHRQINLSSLSQEAIAELIHNDMPPSKKGLDGWEEPEIRYPEGIRQFVNTALRVLTHSDWASLLNAAYCDMHESPAAFDVLSGLYWGLRDKKINRLPSRNVAWLMLKLMAAVPARVRVVHPGAKFCPLQLLPKRQINESGRTSSYPVSFPRGPRLEAALRRALDSNLRKRHPEPVDWIGLCYGLDQLLD